MQLATIQQYTLQTDVLTQIILLLIKIPISNPILSLFKTNNKRRESTENDHSSEANRHQKDFSYIKINDKNRSKENNTMMSSSKNQHTS